MTEAGSRDYEDVGEAARELGAEPDEPPVRPVEESDRTVAAVEDEGPVPDLAPDDLDGEPELFREPDEAGTSGTGDQPGGPRPGGSW
ncbi:hypothetical protein [Phytohabitans kaempferiae]|uniref:Uncharacterized protein n=1 Tax=Phytohabitans kaempferiae TaxID=1620943 RepID=A0ABV6M998_9ACTN